MNLKRDGSELLYSNANRKCMPVTQQPNPIQISLLPWGKPQGNIIIALRGGMQDDVIVQKNQTELS